MRILLYFEAENLIKTSGIGRAFAHQKAALESAGIDYTIDPFDDDFDILHINTVGPSSEGLIKKAHAQNKKVIYHAHSTEEDFKNSFILSNQIAPLYGKYLTNLYDQADLIITPTVYSKSLLEGYGTISKPVVAISNGIDLEKYQRDEEKVKAYRKYFDIKDDDKVVISAGLYFERKGILDFIEIAKALPEIKFIWFGYSNPLTIPKNIRDVIEDHPMNVILPGYVKGPIIEGAYSDANCFFFPSYEETEGIVTLEALASKCKCIVRNIGVYDEWLYDKKNCYMGNNNEEFIKLISDVVNNKVPDLSLEGYKTAVERSIPNIGQELKKTYEMVLKM